MLNTLISHSFIKHGDFKLHTHTLWRTHILWWLLFSYPSAPLWFALTSSHTHPVSAVSGVSQDPLTLFESPSRAGLSPPLPLSLSTFVHEPCFSPLLPSDYPFTLAASMCVVCVCVCASVCFFLLSFLVWDFISESDKASVLVLNLQQICPNTWAHVRGLLLPVNSMS